MLNYKAILQLAKNDLHKTFETTLKMFFWLTVGPLLMLPIYNVVFSEFIPVSIKYTNSFGTWSFPLFLFTGVLILTLFLEAISRAASGLEVYSFILKKTTFDIKNIPFVFIFLNVLAISPFITILFIYTLFTMPENVVYVLVLMFDYVNSLTVFVLFFLVAGYLFDAIRFLLPTLSLLLMYLSPVFYSVDNVPQEYASYYMLLPMSHSIETARSLIFLETPNIGYLFIYKSISYFLIAYLGFIVLKPLKKVVTNGS